jgi:hypothetical protein
MYQLTHQAFGCKMWLTEQEYKLLPNFQKQYYVDMTSYFRREQNNPEIVEEPTDPQPTQHLLSEQVAEPELA